MGDKSFEPLWITPLVKCERDEPDVGHYEILQSLVTETPDRPGGEIETALEVYYGPTGAPLWKRVIVQYIMLKLLENSPL